jgi:hypothetical protein
MANLLMATSKLVCEVKAWYLQLGSTLDVVPSADGRRLPTVIKGVLDDGADDTGTGARDVRGIPHSRPASPKEMRSARSRTDRGSCSSAVHLNSVAPMRRVRILVLIASFLAATGFSPAKILAQV